MTENLNPSQILEANEDFICDLDGERIVVIRGRTRIRANHKLAKAYPARFQPIEQSMTYPDVEEATDEPGESQRRSRTLKGSHATTIKEH